VNTLKGEEALLKGLIRARLTSKEYDGLSKGEIEKLYILEEGEPPPEFDIITTKELGIGEQSGFDGTAIHFHDEGINEVYIINRGTEWDQDNFAYLFDNKIGNIRDYKKNPEDLREIAFQGNEDLYVDVFGVMMGEDQSQTVDNIDFTDQVIEKVKQTGEGENTKFYLDGHSLGGSESQNLLTVYGDLFENVNVYNDAPMNIYNIILVNDKLKKTVEEKYGLKISNIKDLQQIDQEELESLLDRELGDLSEKITYYRNEGDLITTLTLPNEYRLVTSENVKIFESTHSDLEMIDLATKYPLIMEVLEDTLGTATTDGVSYIDAASLYGSYLGSTQFPEFMQNDLQQEIVNLQKDYMKMDGESGYVLKEHGLNSLIEHLAKGQGREIVNNQEIICVSGSGGGKSIQLNIDVVYEYYVVAHSILLGKESSLETLEERYDSYITSTYNRHQECLILKTIRAPTCHPQIDIHRIQRIISYIQILNSRRIP